MYIDVEYLDKYIKELVGSKELDILKWSTVSQDDKKVLIGKATAYIDSLNYRGKKLEIGQLNSFPRIIDGVVTSTTKVELATVYCCIAFLKQDNSKRLRLQSEGVKSIDLGGVKESYDSNSNLIDDKMVKMYLKPYIFCGVLG